MLNERRIHSTLEKCMPRDIAQVKRPIYQFTADGYYACNMLDMTEKLLERIITWWLDKIPCEQWLFDRQLIRVSNGKFNY